MTTVTLPAIGTWTIDAAHSRVGFAAKHLVVSKVLGTTTDPWGTDKAASEAVAEIDREAFGLTWNQALETGGVLVGRHVRVEIDVQLQPAG